MKKLLLTILAALLLSGCAAAPQANSEYSAEDINFAEMMIPHHEGAITMAQKVTGSKNKEVAALAAAIIEAQEKEIAFMRELVKFY
jgi:uncharacterized protein (DUF305 family)